MTQIDTSREAVAALVRKLRSQIGDDVQEAYSHEALFRGASEALTALLARAEAAETERDALQQAMAVTAQAVEALMEAATEVELSERLEGLWDVSVGISNTLAKHGDTK